MYTFKPILPEDHFVSQYIAYASRQTDAAYEYHEAAAFFLLANATPGVRAMLAPYPKGLPTNLYMLIIGDSTVSRKSTVIRITEDILDSAVTNAKVSNQASPEGFVEELAQHSGSSSAWLVDEFGDMLDKLHHAKYMAGFKGLLLTVYDGSTYRYRRHSKRMKGGGTEEDVDVVERPHLSILGATTPVLFQELADRDVASGLLPRFAVIMPDGKPERMPFFEVRPADIAMRNRLVQWLHAIMIWTASGKQARFEEDALQTIDFFSQLTEEQVAHETTEGAKTMLQRLIPMAVKLAMLVACGRPETIQGAGDLVVREEDASLACLVAERWKAYAVDFAHRIGESELERQIRRVMAIIDDNHGAAARRTIARAAHLSKRELDAIEETLIDRGLITPTIQESAHGPNTIIWSRPEYGEAVQ